MADPPEYSDPIVIPIAITIPDPRFRDTFHHPSLTDPDWFRRQRDRPRYTLAQLGIPLPRLAPPMPLPRPHAPDPADVDEAIARARRRAREALRELSQGEIGSAAGHLLLGQPFPEAVDDPFGTSLHNEAADAAPDQPGDNELDQLTDEAEKDLEGRLGDMLDERHLQAAEADRRGEPVIGKNGKRYDHENEVAAGVRGLRSQRDKLTNRLKHDQRYGNPEQNKEAIARAELVVDRSERRWMKSIVDCQSYEFDREVTMQIVDVGITVRRIVDKLGAKGEMTDAEELFLRHTITEVSDRGVLEDIFWCFKRKGGTANISLIEPHLWNRDVRIAEMALWTLCWLGEAKRLQPYIMAAIEPGFDRDPYRDIADTALAAAGHYLKDHRDADFAQLLIRWAPPEDIEEYDDDAVPPGMPPFVFQSCLSAAGYAMGLALGVASVDMLDNDALIAACVKRFVAERQDG